MVLESDTKMIEKIPGPNPSNLNQVFMSTITVPGAKMKPGSGQHKDFTWNTCLRRHFIFAQTSFLRILNPFVAINPIVYRSTSHPFDVPNFLLMLVSHMVGLLLQLLSRENPSFT